MRGGPGIRAFAGTPESPSLNVQPLLRLAGPIRGVRFPIVLAMALSACGGGPGELPEPRPLVIQSGARLMVTDMVRQREIYDEVNHLLQVIAQDPSFLIDARPESRDVYPWETLEVVPDTARVQYQRTAPDLRGTYEIYAFLHLMRDEGRVEEFLPDAVGANDWEYEQAVMEKVADSWLLGRAVFDLAPYFLMDEVIYAYEAGLLDALLLNRRPVEFAEAREAWLAANPAADQEFRTWYRETFDREPPGPPTDG